MPSTPTPAAADTPFPTSENPVSSPSKSPLGSPTAQPTAQPTPQVKTVNPSAQPTAVDTPYPTSENPVSSPSKSPLGSPTAQPTSEVTGSPSAEVNPTARPTPKTISGGTPSGQPTGEAKPSPSPSLRPTELKSGEEALSINRSQDGNYSLVSDPKFYGPGIVVVALLVAFGVYIVKRVTRQSPPTKEVSGQSEVELQSAQTEELTGPQTGLSLDDNDEFVEDLTTKPVIPAPEKRGSSLDGRPHSRVPLATSPTTSPTNSSANSPAPQRKAEKFEDGR